MSRLPLGWAHNILTERRCMNPTKIPYCDFTWNPGCGCSGELSCAVRCWAADLHNRRHRAKLAGKDLPKQYEKPFDEIQLFPDRLDAPLRRKKPATVAVWLGGDMFDRQVPLRYIRWTWRVMERCPQHRFLILTKQLDRLANIIGPTFPDHIWLGTSCRTQLEADERIAKLLQIPAARRWVSLEPLLEPVDVGLSTATCDCCDRWSSRWIELTKRVMSDVPFADTMTAGPGIYRAQSNRHGALSVLTASGFLGVKPSEFKCLPGLDWVVVGCESGKDRRPCKREWVRSIIDQCDDAGVPVFVKQIDINGKVSRDPAEWPEWARRQEVPE